MEGTEQQWQRFTKAVTDHLGLPEGTKIVYTWSAEGSVISYEGVIPVERELMEALWEKAHRDG